MTIKSLPHQLHCQAVRQWLKTRRKFSMMVKDKSTTRKAFRETYNKGKCRTYHQMPTYVKWHSNAGTWGGLVDNFCHLTSMKNRKLGAIIMHFKDENSK